MSARANSHTEFTCHAFIPSFATSSDRFCFGPQSLSLYSSQHHSNISLSGSNEGTCRPSSRPSMNRLKQIHAYGLRNGFDNTRYLVLCLLQIPDTTYARRLLLHQSSCPTTFLFNNLVQSYSTLKQPHQCLRLFSLMMSSSLPQCPPNEHTFTVVFPTAAASLDPLCIGAVHALFVESGFGPDVYACTALVGAYAKVGELSCARKAFDEMPSKDLPVWNALVYGYARRGDVNEAVSLFRSMPSRNVVSWTSVISGFSQNGEYGNALRMFLEMEVAGVEPNEVTVTSVLPACANLGALEVGEKIVKYSREKGFIRNLFVSNAMLEMYARCGEVDAARRVFDEIRSKRNLCSWNTMIMSLATHGRSNEALHLYRQMQEVGILPDDITFVGLLQACIHGGLLSEGEQFFDAMNSEYRITPKLEHYGCMVDLLGRAGNLREAYKLVRSMPMKPDSVIWGALLGACSFHGNVEFAEKAVDSLVVLEPWNPGNYVILSNIYASVGDWDGVARLRKFMKAGQITKTAGYSLIEEGGEIHKFIVGDRSHIRSDDIYVTLGAILALLKPEIQARHVVYEFLDC